MKRFEVYFTIQVVVPFEAQDRAHVANWALKLGAEEIIHRQDPERVKIAVTGIYEIGG